jgi:hypothetical protein
LLRLGFRLVAQLDVDGEVVRAEGGQPREREQLEVVGVEDVVERPPEQRIVCIEGTV